MLVAVGARYDDLEPVLDAEVSGLLASADRDRSGRPRLLH
jgi:hypothetical protein